MSENVSPVIRQRATGCSGRVPAVCSVSLVKDFIVAGTQERSVAHVMSVHAAL